jgi:hypothetical protein
MTIVVSPRNKREISRDSPRFLSKTADAPNVRANLGPATANEVVFLMIPDMVRMVCMGSCCMYGRCIVAVVVDFTLLFNASAFGQSRHPLRNYSKRQ